MENDGGGIVQDMDGEGEGDNPPDRNAQFLQQQRGRNHAGPKYVSSTRGLQHPRHGVVLVRWHHLHPHWDHQPGAGEGGGDGHLGWNSATSLSSTMRLCASSP